MSVCLVLIIRNHSFLGYLFALLSAMTDGLFTGQTSCIHVKVVLLFLFWGNMKPESISDPDWLQYPASIEAYPNFNCERPSDGTHLSE
jgi:hypothetical protein